jgi:hypothetical protein
MESIILTQSATNTARLKIESVDEYGNIGTAYSDGFFTILSFEESVLVDTTNIQVGISANFVIDQVIPVLVWVYPNNNDVFEGGANIYPLWDADDPSFDGTDVDIYFSESNGSDFILYDDFSQIPHNSMVQFPLPNLKWMPLIIMEIQILQLQEHFSQFQIKSSFL